MKKVLILISWLILTTLAIAATTTTNYSLYKPATGDKNWGSQINQNFDTIDTTMKATNDLADTAVTPAELTAAISTKVDDADLGVANGVATLGADSKVPTSQLPDSLTGALTYQGVLDASGGVYPSDPEQGYYYIVSIAGTIDGTAYLIGDWAVYNGASWDKIDNSASSSGWTVGGGVVQLVDDGNDVGIGTAAPSSELEVVGTVTATAFAGDLTGAVTGNADTATVASALAANGANCSAGSYPLGVDASGAVESCTDATTEIDSAIGTHAAITTLPHGATANNTASRIVYRDASGNFAAGTITATLVGNASTATALATNPSDCGASQYASSIDASGNLTCSTPTSSIAGLTTNYIVKATGATSIGNSSLVDNGSTITTTETITSPTFIGALTGNASTATALAANGTNCTTGTYPLGIDASGNAETCEAVNAIDLSNLDQGIYFDTNGIYNIGTAAEAIKDIHVDGAIYSYSSGTSVFGDDVEVDGTVTATGRIYGASATFGNVLASNALEVGGTDAAYSAYTCTAAACYAGSYYVSAGDDWELGVGGSGNVMYFYNTTVDKTYLRLDSTNGVTLPNGRIQATPVAAQTIAATNTIAADACGGIKQITASGAVTTNTTDTFTAPAAGNSGCVLHVCNVGAQNITLDNNAKFYSAGAADVVMTPNDCVVVANNGTAWYQVSALVAN
jgi:hypothetical protein